MSLFNGHLPSDLHLQLIHKGCRVELVDGEVNSKQFQSSIPLYVFSTRSQCPSQPTVLPSVSATTFKCSCPLQNWLDSPILSNRLVSFQYTYLKVCTMTCSLLQNRNRLPLLLFLSLIIQVFTCQDYLLQAFVFESNLRSL